MIAFLLQFKPGYFTQLNLEATYSCELENYDEVVDSMKISLWPAGVRIPQKYNVKVNKDCEESRGETVSYFQLIFLYIVYFLGRWLSVQKCRERTRNRRTTVCS